MQRIDVTIKQVEQSLGFWHQAAQAATVTHTVQTKEQYLTTGVIAAAGLASTTLHGGYK